MTCFKRDPNARHFMAFKVDLRGPQRNRPPGEDHYDFVRGLTLEEAQDPERVPYGRHLEADGRPYIWCESLMEEHVR